MNIPQFCECVCMQLSAPLILKALKKSGVQADSFKPLPGALIILRSLTVNTNISSGFIRSFCTPYLMSIKCKPLFKIKYQMVQYKLLIFLFIRLYIIVLNAPTHPLSRYHHQYLLPSLDDTYSHIIQELN